jgi:predicted nucleic acid-binding protein
MTFALVDTTVIVHLLRRYAPALTWYGSQSQELSIVFTTWLEILEGAPNKAEQTRYTTLLDQFQMVFLTESDQRWAMERLKRFHFSHRIGKEDCQIAAAAHRLQVPLYTHNLKDMKPLIGSLATKPYP